MAVTDFSNWLQTAVRGIWKRLHLVWRFQLCGWLGHFLYAYPLILPFSSTFTGHLNGAEALYDGSNRNLIGVRKFISGTPQLAVLLGLTRFTAR